MCCTCATSCGELSSRIAPAPYTILSAMHRSSTDKLRCSRTGAGSSDSGTGSSPMTTGGCSSGSSWSMRRPSSSGSPSGTGVCSGSSSTSAVSSTTPALLDLKRLPAACASPAARMWAKQSGRYRVWTRCRWWLHEPISQWRVSRSVNPPTRFCSAKWRLALRAMALLKLFIMDLSRGWLYAVLPPGMQMLFTQGSCEGSCWRKADAVCTDAQSNKSIHGRYSSVGFSTFSRNWTSENMDSVDCQCDSVKFKWTSCSTGPCGRTALVFPPKMSWQNEGPCNIGTASVAVMFDLPACTCFVFSPFTDQPVALTGIIRSEVSSLPPRWRLQAHIVWQFISSDDRSV